MDKAEIKKLMMWAVKWAIAGIIVIVALQGRIVLDEMRETLVRHNQLLSAVVNEFRVVAMKRAEIEKAQQEFLQKGDSTEEPK